VGQCPCHKPLVHRTIPGLIVLFLTPYSPELSPAEHFFEELRKATANATYASIEKQEAAIEKKLLALTADTSAMKQLIGYGWIRKQLSEVN